MRFIIILSLLLFIVSCNPPTIPNIIINNTLSISEGGRPDGEIQGNCPVVDRVNISASPSSLVVGQSERIDVTPKTSDGKPRDPDCDIRSGVQWDSNDEVCRVGDSSEFVTTIRGVAPGTCTIKACVENKCATDSFQVS